jgi:hypothetical protein
VVVSRNEENVKKEKEHMTIVKSNLDELSSRIDVGAKEANDVLYKLVEELGKYGFRGSAEVSLTVDLRDNIDGPTSSVRQLKLAIGR